MEAASFEQLFVEQLIHFCVLLESFQPFRISAIFFIHFVWTPAWNKQQNEGQYTFGGARDFIIQTVLNYRKQWNFYLGLLAIHKRWRTPWIWDCSTHWDYILSNKNCPKSMFATCNAMHILLSSLVWGSVQIKWTHMLTVFLKVRLLCDVKIFIKMSKSASFRAAGPQHDKWEVR